MSPTRPLDGPGWQTFLDAWARSLLVGGAFGLLETSLSYATGMLPREDAWIPFVAGLGLWSGLGSAFGALLGGLVSVGRLDPRRASRLACLALLLAPPALFALRGAPGASALGMAVVVVPLVWRGRCAALEPGALGAFVSASLLTQGAGLFGLGLRTADSHGWVQPLRVFGLLLSVLSLALLLRWAAHRCRGLGTYRLAGIGVLGAALLSAAAGICWGTRPLVRSEGRASTAGPARGPEILLIVLDTVRADHLSVYGYSRRTTPTLDALANRSLIFLSAHAPSPYTLSSHASLFTGLSPSQHGAHPVPMGPTGTASREDGPDLALYEEPLSEAAVTLAEQLDMAGYRTAGIVANNVYLSEWSGLSQGFAYYDCRLARVYGYEPSVLPLARRLGGRLLARVSPETTLRADEVTDRALAWLARSQGHPFFLFLNYLDAHEPHQAPAGYDRLFAPELGAGRFDWTAVEKRLVGGRGEMTPAEREHFVAQYDGETAFVDAELGRLLRSLDEAGRLDPMLVIVTSDHGEYLGEHRRVGHANGLHEEVLHVPLLVKLPGQHERVEVPERVSLQDVPRIIGFVRAGAREAAAIPALLKSAGSGVVAEFWFTDADRELDPRRFSSAVVRASFDRQWKLIETLQGDDELYDLGIDPGEYRNLLEADPTRAAGVRALMRGALPPLEAIRGESRPGPPAPLVLERLRSLGYAQ